MHVNVALIVKFMPNYFFAPAEYPEVPVRRDAEHDAYLFEQAPTRGLGKIRFHDWAETFDRFDAVWNEVLGLMDSYELAP